jgi:hypothetical protein
MQEEDFVGANKSERKTVPWELYTADLLANDWEKYYKEEKSNVAISEGSKNGWKSIHETLSSSGKIITNTLAQDIDGLGCLVLVSTWDQSSSHPSEALTFLPDAKIYTSDDNHGYVLDPPIT